MGSRHVGHRLLPVINKISRMIFIQLEQTTPEFVIAGQLIDSQNQPVANAGVGAKVAGQGEPLREVDSQEDAPSFWSWTAGQNWAYRSS